MARKQKQKQITRQKGGWLNRYNFEYGRQDAINTGLTTLKRIAPGPN